MLKNKIWLGIILSIFLLVFSIPGFTAYYKYTQESGANFYVGTADKADALEDTNEMRQIIDDLGALLVHSKRNDLYPKDGTTGGTLQIPEAGLKFSNAPANDDIAAYIADEMKWQTKAELGLDLSLYYLKTAIDTQGKVETIWSVTLATDTELAALTYSDVGAEQADAGLTSLAGLTYVSPSFIKVTATDVYAIRTIAETKTDLSLNYVENLKVKLDGTQAPTVNNDTDEGYVVGSRWFDVTNDKEYVCLDNTDGAAVWTETTGAGGGASTFTALTDTPANYTDQAGKYVKVNAGEDALEFGTPVGGGDALTTDPLSQFAATTSAELAGVISDETGTGVLVFANAPNINLYDALASDHTYSGLLDTQPVGESVVFGDLLYFDWTDKEWKKAKADAYVTTPAERIALESKADGETCLMLVKGYIRDDSAFDFGASRIFLNDDSAGTCDDTLPAESGDQIQVVGTAKNADILFFNPSIDVGEI